MKECLHTTKHQTCRHRAWNGNRVMPMCIEHTSLCNYKQNFIKFEDIPDDTIMYCGDIESTHEFKTKSEWIKDYGHSDFPAEVDTSWYTATISTAKLKLADLLCQIEEDCDMYEDWCGDVCSCLDDPIVVAGISRLNEIFEGYPTYTEDTVVLFVSENERW